MNETPNEYLKINSELWDRRCDEHVKSDFYNMNEFLKGKTSLNDIELEILGNIEGKSVLHLQCHFGQDSISLSKMGSKVVGVDFSKKSIETANEIALKLGVDTKFICCSIYDLTSHLKQKFDIVYASYGTIPWLPNLNKWSHIIKTFLKPNGKFIFVEFHPFVWMFNDQFTEMVYDYSSSDPIVETEEGTYANPLASIAQKSITWNHSLSNVVTSLINSGLKIELMKEYDYSPYPFVKNTVEVEKNKFRIERFKNKIPLVYSLVATAV